MADNLDARGHDVPENPTEFIAQTQSINAISTRHGCKLKHQLILSQRSHENTGLPGIENNANTYGVEKDNFEANSYIGMDGRTDSTHAPEILQNNWNSEFAASPSSPSYYHNLNSMQQNLQLEDAHSPMLGQIPQECQPYQ